MNSQYALGRDGKNLTKAATKAAFDLFRTQYGPAWGPRKTPNAQESDQLDAAGGLKELIDGPGQDDGASDRLQPFSAESLPVSTRLWVVRADDVAYAAEVCDFSTGMIGGKLKHTNLTGGEPAFSGGELLILNDNTLVVSGDSGRYGPRSADEMLDVAIAFRNAGYTVYSTGYDEEASRALPLIGPAAKRV